MVGKPEPTYALQLVRPFWNALRMYPQFPPAFFEAADKTPDDTRIPVRAGQEFLANAVKLTGEPNLGLIVARSTKLGAFDVLEYAAGSAPTWQAAGETAFRYIRLMNEAANFRLEVQGDKACFILDSTVELTRVGIDFQSAAFHVASARWVDPLPPELEAWFTYPEPDRIDEHRATFRGVNLRFNAPWNGFRYDAARLSTKLASADPALHRVLRDHAEQLLAKLAPGDSLVEHVRAQVLASLKTGPLGAEDVAKRLGFTRRTLTRRLQQERTTFSDVLEGVRKEAAVHYLEASDNTVEDIAFLLGFSESSAFVRAFKRWQGVAPAAYRRSARPPR